jgi:hypothetical protein
MCRQERKKENLKVEKRRRRGGGGGGKNKRWKILYRVSQNLCLNRDSQKISRRKNINSGTPCIYLPRWVGKFDIVSLGKKAKEEKREIEFPS